MGRWVRKKLFRVTQASGLSSWLAMVVSRTELMHVRGRGGAVLMRWMMSLV